MKWILKLIWVLTLTQGKLFGQISPCTEVVNVQVIAMSPQSGQHNYFGVKVVLNKTYSSDVIVKGIIYDMDNTTGIPFELTVIEGYTEAQTATNFYQTSPTAEASLTITSVNPFLLSDETAFFRTSGDCGSVSNDLVNTINVIFDSIDVINEYLNNIIELDDDEIIEFCHSIFENGIPATSSIYNIDSIYIHLFINKIENSIYSLINNFKISIVGNTSWSELSGIQLDSLGQSLMSATLASRMAPEELGMLGDGLYECAATAASQFQWQWYLLLIRLDVGPFGGMTETQHIALNKFYFFSAVKQIIIVFQNCIFP